ncbi:MAG: glycosyltransferase family 4 protein [Sedimentisphaerales bacterium]|jgi:glycosyltransferase involved in cell wall biosynthesis|nr:glycosyltransferase family 4 protein [Sedimentisphaerales bacterium]HNY78545.1 glycosyltransferase family 4 protein [Sedimentisphaerales bacterium]HOC63797.1 glycosyltransferase family 4 protein [Sedimentisphaerales bacterium]HOH64527.1 glycosyltransferase family 4 protein [Sedimentisphaerales bacterium]HQA88687.1 glycosyltransferase family 4 protein [Sedimentisphaerales bacterium]
MGKDARKKVVFISSFPPRKCGIATFTTDLIRNTAAAAGGQFEPLVVTMRSDSVLRYNDPVKFEIRQNVRRDYICAADYINFSHVDLVSVQHEFGLFGGEAGSYLGLLLKRMKAPVVTTLHTILESPQPAYRRSMLELCDCSDVVVTMNERGVDMLTDIYGVGHDKIRLIAHGIPDLPFVDSNYYKHKFGLEGRRTILTFGLMNRNKGIEVMLRAMPRIVEAHPDVTYIILGMTHPLVQEYEGESYRFSLQQIVSDLRLQDHVIFHNRFVDDAELHNFLCAADIYVTPYLSHEQLTSGTLAFAVGTGKAVVSTPYWAAMELLADNRGRLVPFGDSEHLAQTILDLLQNEGLFYELRGRAYDYGRSRTWPKIGQAYWKLFSEIEVPVHMTAKVVLTAAETISSIEAPEPSLDHLLRLTDDTGLYQHARFTIPDRAHGYCTDDNARGAIAMAKYYSQYPDPHALRLLDTYLSFLVHAQNPDGSVRNFMNFHRTWREDEPAHDALGRTLWALGTVMACPPLPAHLSLAKDCFDHSVGQVHKQHPRGMAYAILGMCDYLRQFPGASDIKRQMELAADGLVRQYEENRQRDWEWFEDILTYDNAVLPHALFAAGRSLHNETYARVAGKTAEFLLDNTFDGDHFSFIGCQGWYERGKPRAVFDQQPIEAAGTVLMLRAAYDATKNPHFLTLQRKAFDWFLGANDLRVPLYDFQTRGCSDGLMAGGVNGNQGAESTVSLLLALLAIIESCATIDKASNNEPTDAKRSRGAP